MYAGFKLNLSSRDFQQLTSPLHVTTKNPFDEIKDDLEKYFTAENAISAEKIRKDWFPLVDAHVFISHSHADSDNAKILAKWLYSKFKIKAFIDSDVWGFSNNLLKKIDDRYSRDPSQNSYNYEKRNTSTAHVHMMLISALAMMIDRCESLLFLSTTNSLKDGLTYSPWIYNELVLSKLLRRKSPQEHRRIIAEASISYDSVSTENLRVSYEPELAHLESLTLTNLNDWSSRGFSSAHKALDWLYS